MNTLPHLTQAASQTPDRHLTGEQIFDLLDQPDRAAPGPRLHLSACAACRAELASLRESLDNFRSAATNLACAQAPAFAPRPVEAAHPRPIFRRSVWAASFATAAALLAFSLSLIPPHFAGPPAPPAAFDAAAPAAQPAVSDEALLDGIQQDLSTSIPPSLEPLAVPAASGETKTQN